VRLEAAHDQVETRRWLESLPKVDYVAKRHWRQESLAGWLEQAVALGERPRRREGKEGWSGATGLARGDEQRRVVFQVIRRTSPATGQRLRLPTLPVPTWGTRWRAPPAAVIALYHRHGTSELFHSDLKTDRDLERLPAGQFAVNVLSCGWGWWPTTRCGWVARRRCARVRGNRRHPCRWHARGAGSSWT